LTNKEAPAVGNVANLGTEGRTLLTFDLIVEAHKGIAPYVRKTPLLRSDFLSDLAQGEVYLKLENLQRLNSFKIRGMVNRMTFMTHREKERGLLVVSSGNFGIAASFCGRQWGVPVEVYVSEMTPSTKIQMLRSFGAQVNIVGKDYDDCLRNMWIREGPNPTKTYVDSSCDPYVVAGYGTIALEVLQEMPDVDNILVPVGGGGLITGIGLAAKTIRPDVRVVGVQTEACPSMIASLRDNKCYEEYPSGPSICEALIGGIGKLPFTFASRCIDEVVMTGERAIYEALRTILLYDKVLLEPSAAVGVSYVIENAERLQGRKTVLIISGGNIGRHILLEIVKTMARCTSGSREAGPVRRVVVDG